MRSIGEDLGVEGEFGDEEGVGSRVLDGRVRDQHQLQVSDLAGDLAVLGEVETVVDAAVQQDLVFLVNDQQVAVRPVLVQRQDLLY